METRIVAFNIKLGLVLGLALLLAGCAGTSGVRSGKDKEAATLRLHLQINEDSSERGQRVPIYRASPTKIYVSKDWFVNEGDVIEAAVVQTLGGIAIMIQFNKHGTLLLDSVTTRYRGQRIAIYSQFGDARWLAAPVIERRIANGIFTFTPDASPEEAERIVRGLNNVAKEMTRKTWK